MFFFVFFGVVFLARFLIQNGANLTSVDEVFFGVFLLFFVVFFVFFGVVFFFFINNLNILFHLLLMNFSFLE